MATRSEKTLIIKMLNCEKSLTEFSRNLRSGAEVRILFISIHFHYFIFDSVFFSRRRISVLSRFRRAISHDCILANLSSIKPRTDLLKFGGMGYGPPPPGVNRRKKFRSEDRTGKPTFNRPNIDVAARGGGPGRYRASSLQSSVCLVL